MLNEVDNSRRNFLKLATLGAAGTLLAGTSSLLIKENIENFTPQQSLEALAMHDVQLIAPPPPEFIGTSINIPFAFNDKDLGMVDLIADRMEAMDINMARIMVPDAFEFHLGEYNYNYTNGLINSVRRINTRTGGKTRFNIVLADTFNIFHVNKVSPVYGSSSPDHAWMRHARTRSEIQEAYMDIFNDPSMLGYIQRRIAASVDALSPIHQFVASWEPFNELEVPFQCDDPTAVATELYANVLPVIANKTPDITIATGLADPTLVYADQLVDYGLGLNSAHLYLGKASRQQRNLKLYNGQRAKGNTSLPPAKIDEVGFTQSFLGFNLPQEQHDLRLSDYIRSVIEANMTVDEATQTVSLEIAHIGVWQLLTNKKSQDGFHFNPEQYPQTLHTLNLFKEMLQKGKSKHDPGEVYSP